MRPTEGSLHGDVFQLVFFPAVVLHEASHWLAYTAAGVDSEINLHCFAFDRTRSHVQPRERPSPRAQFFSTVAPVTLLVPALLSVPLVRATTTELPVPDGLVPLALVVTSLGLVAVARPSQPDLTALFVAAGYVDGVRISLVDRLTQCFGVWTVALWYTAVGDGLSVLTSGVVTFATLLVSALFVVMVGYDALTDRWGQREKQIRHSIASIHFERGAFAAAEEHCRAAIEHDETDGELHASLAAICEEQGRLEAAEQHCETAMVLNPNHPLVFVNYASVCLERDRLDDARAHCERALELDDSLSIAHVAYAEVLFEQGETQAAETHCERALDAEPAHPEVHTVYADLLERQDRLAEAEEQYRAALDLDPGYWRAREGYADLLGAQGREAELHEHVGETASER